MLYCLGIYLYVGSSFSGGQVPGILYGLSFSPIFISGPRLLFYELGSISIASVALFLCNSLFSKEFIRVTELLLHISIASSSSSS